MLTLQHRWGAYIWKKNIFFFILQLFFRWNFRPQQPIVYVHPGENALAFYTAKNPTEKYAPDDAS